MHNSKYHVNQIDLFADVRPSRMSDRDMAAIAADPETYRQHYEHDPAETKRLAEEIKQRINIKDLSHLCPGWECKKGMTCSTLFASRQGATPKRRLRC
jgi:hypothetical protein